MQLLLLITVQADVYIDHLVFNHAQLTFVNGSITHAHSVFYKAKGNIKMVFTLSTRFFTTDDKWAKVLI
jgi:hypothetical protein